MSPKFPVSLTDFIKLVLPELRRRDLFRIEYSGRTLRKLLRLDQPVPPVTTKYTQNA